MEQIWPTRLEIEQASIEQLKIWLRDLTLPIGYIREQKVKRDWIEFRIEFLTGGIVRT